MATVRPYGTVAKTNQVPSTNWFNRCRHIIWTELYSHWLRIRIDGTVAGSRIAGYGSVQTEWSSVH